MCTKVDLDNLIKSYGSGRIFVLYCIVLYCIYTFI